MIRKAVPENRPWKPRPIARRPRRRRLVRRACMGCVCGRVARFLESRERPRRFAEIATAPGMGAFVQPLIFAALRILVDRGEAHYAVGLKTRKRSGFETGAIFPLFWHRRWSFPGLTPDDGPGGDHG